MKIAFITGAFDGLHIGHLYILGEAKKLGWVVAAVNSDEDVRRSKGPERPVLNLSQRVLALNKWADAVFPFTGKEELLSLINWIKPHYRVVGDDYAEEQVIGAAEVKSWGGQVVIIKRLPGISTTEILEAKGAAS